jgi:hypothetical protein
MGTRRVNFSFLGYDFYHCCDLFCRHFECPSLLNTLIRYGGVGQGEPEGQTAVKIDSMCGLGSLNNLND